jgi:hypothetical protein
VADPVLPPSKFVAGYTVGATASAPPTAASASQSAGWQGSSGTATVASPGDLNRLAVFAFVLALFLGWLTAPLTIPLAYKARDQIRRSGQDGASLAKAALVISVIYLTLAITVLMLWFYGVSSQ